MRTLKLVLAYDGTDFSGWQQQPGRRTVQGVLAEALGRLTGEEIQPAGSGRTDAGVHALGQVVSFHTRSQLPAATFQRALNALLPHDVLVVAAGEAPAAFHAVRDAKRKRYCYLVDDSLLPSPFLRRYAWQLRQPLDEGAMHRAGQFLLGRHDFASFQTAGSPRASTVRTIYSLVVRRPAARPFLEPSGAGEAATDHGSRNDPRAGQGGDKHPVRAGEGGEGAPGSERQAREKAEEAAAAASVESRAVQGGETAAGGAGGDPDECCQQPSPALPFAAALLATARLLLLHIEADGFLYNMARAIVGTLVEVGTGRRPESWVAEVLAARDRSRAGKTAPPHGLYLVEVLYDEPQAGQGESAAEQAG
jgi:tRNA pseudouridine38-40 synthase